MIRVPLVPFRRTVFCGAKRRQGPPDATCRRPAGWGTDHVGWGSCKFHGGCTPSHTRAIALKQAGQIQGLFGVPRDDIDEISGLIEELQRSAGLIDSYEAMCAQLGADEVVFGVLTSEETRVEGEGDDLTPREVKTKRGASINTWVRLLNAERDRFTKLCEAMVKLDLERRRVDLGQGHVAALVQVLLSPELALNEEQRRAAARMLREIDARPIEGSVA
jgi:hypothetical protein